MGAFLTRHLNGKITVGHRFAIIANHYFPLNAALVCKGQKSVCGLRVLFYVLAIHLFVFQFHELSGGTILEAFAVR